MPDEYAKTADIPTKPSDIGAQPEGDYALRSEIPSVPVKSVNGKTGAVSLSASDVKARPDTWMPSASDVGALPNTTKIPAKTSDLTNDSGFITGYTETDPTVPAWAKNATKPSYSKSEVGLGNVENVKQYSASNPPPYPVTSVNGKTGAVTVTIPTVPTKVSAFTNDAGYLTQHQDISGKLDASALPTAIDTALAQAKASGEFDGEDGQRGTGLLPVTTAPSGYTTAVGGITPKYRMAISTIKTQAGVTEVLLGDTIRYSYYHYPIDYLDASYAYFTERVSIRGATGAAGTTPVKGTDYFTDADKQEIAEAAAELIPGFVSTFAELKAATLAKVTPIVLDYGVTIEATERLTFQAGTTLIGNGATIKRAAGHEDRVIYLHANCRVQDLIIDGNRTAMVSPKWENTREVSTSAGCVIDNVTINNGNEAIVVFGDNCVVTNCNINNCAGNGIHFTGSNNVRVENCRVINANLRTDGSIGHEDGCIIWSDDCDHIVCSNNWCEGGISGFGSIDDAHNSHVKLIGNTVKNCTKVIDLCYWNKAPHDIAISNNTFIDSGMIDLNKQNNQIFVPGNILVNGNLFINTDAKFHHVTDVTMIGNIFKNGTPMFVRCARVSITNNIVNNAVNDASDGIIARQCVNVTVDGNYVRAKREVLNVGYSTGVTVRGNNIRNVYNSSNTDYCINCSSVNNLIFDGNTVVLYRKGMSVPSYASITNNVFLCASNGFNSLNLSNSRTNVIIRNNRINGGKSFAVIANSVIEDNDIGANDDVFVSVTKAFTGRSVDLPAKATKGDEFAFTIVPNEGYAFPETIYVTNNGVTMDVNEYEYDNATGNVLIHCVCGDIVITDGTEVDPDPDTPDTPTTNYTNLVPTSIDTDGKVYNGTGYMNGKRLSSSGAVKDLSTSSVTGFIKAKAGDVVRLGGVVLANDPSNCYICAYDNNFAFVGAKVVTGSAYGTNPATIVWDGTICTYTIANVSSIAYIRINAVCDDGPNGAKMIVTVNEEITD